MASSEIFSRAAQHLGGTFAADSATMNFSNTNLGGGIQAPGANFGAGMVTQNVGIQYQQAINRLYEVGSNNVYLVGGRTQGSLNIGRVIGPKAIACAFYAAYGNLCNAWNNHIYLDIASNCVTTGAAGNAALGPIRQPPGGQVVYGIQYCVIVGIGLTVGAQDMIFNESLQMMFVSLEVDCPAVAAAVAA